MNIDLALALAQGNPIFVDVVHHLAERITVLDKTRTYLAEELCGQEFWEIFGGVDHLPHQVGRFISKLAEQSALPIVKAGRTSANALLYRIL